MKRQGRAPRFGSWPLVVAFAVLAAAGSYRAAVAVDAAGLDPPVAVLAVALVLAAFAYLQRSAEVLGFVGSCVLVAFAGYAGLAFARIPLFGSPAGEVVRLGPFGALSSLERQWPLVLTAGIPFALILTVAVALPTLLIPVRRKLDPHANDALWKFVAEHNLRRGA